MAVFKYRALDVDGNTKKGIQEAENERHARDELRGVNLTVIELTKVTNISNNKSLFSMSISIKDLAAYINQLAVMVRAGLPIDSALAVLVEQSVSKRHKIIWSAIKSSVAEGVSLSGSMLKFPSIFPSFLIAGVASGEHSGRLGEVLVNIADALIKKNKFITKVTAAMAYPIVVTLVALSVIVVLLTFVVPQIVEVFSQLEKDLPPLTTGLIIVSEFVGNYLHLFIVFAISLFIAVKLIKNNNSSKKYWDKFWLKTPFFKNMIKEIEAIKFMRTISTLLGGGVVMVDAIYYSLASLNNTALITKMEAAKNEIKEGKSVFLAFEGVNLFDSISLQLVNLGEVTGNMDKSLTDIANMLEDNFNQKINSYLAIFEPLLILIMGGLVLLIVLAILLPIFDLNQIG